MFIGRRKHPHTIASLQSQSDTARHGEWSIPCTNIGLPHKTCQWIEGEPKRRQFCNEPVTTRANDQPSPYCETHHAKCYRPLTQEEK
jgi:hypothetical protein